VNKTVDRCSVVVFDPPVNGFQSLLLSSFSLADDEAEELDGPASSSFACLASSASRSDPPL
jgi:hypothetical protein